MLNRARLDVFTTPEAEVVVAVAVERADGPSVPHQGAPAAVVRVYGFARENEPTALHFGLADAADFSELLRFYRQIHVLGGVAVLVVDAEGTDAFGERARRVRVRAANPPIRSVALGALVAHRAALPLVRLGPVR